MMADHVDEDSLRANRAGRMSPDQRQILRNKTQGVAIWCLILLLAAVFGWALFARITMQSIPLIVLLVENLSLFVGLFLWLIVFALSALYLLGLVNDLRRGWTLQDCGTLSLERLQLPENFFIAHWYFVLDDSRYYPASPNLQRTVEPGKAYCLFFTPSTQTVIAVEPLS